MRYLCALLLVLAACAPADASRPAHHANEPTAPITIVILDVYNYSAQTRVACDGTAAPVDWRAARIEAHVAFTAAPSEHFDVALELYDAPVGTTINVNNPRQNNTAQNTWNAAWKHQNVPPHPPKLSSWPVTTSNHYFGGRDVRVLVKLTVTGRESGAQFVRSCQFDRTG